MRENTLAAADQITSADVAAEAAEMVKQKIVQQAAAAIMAQANQQPSLALKLLLET